jgi:hypothetical protein
VGTLVALATTVGASSDDPPGQAPRYSTRALLNQMWSGNRQGAEGRVRMRYAPMRLADIGTIAPLGMMVGDHVTPSDHMGFGPRDFTAASDRWEVIAPAAGFIVTVTRNRFNIGTPSAPVWYEDYLLILEHSGTMYTWIGLLDHLDPAIVNQIGRELPYGGWFQVRIPVTEGQVLGRFGGNHGIDFTVIDTDVTRTGFVYPEHYVAEAWKIHVVDFFDYLDEPVRADLLAIYRRTAAPLGGKIDYDVDGTLAGNWFVEGTNWLAGVRGAAIPSSTHLLLGQHHLDPTKTTVSLGDFGGRQKQYWIQGNAPNPAAVTVADGVVKYELVYASLLNGGDPFDAAPFGVQGVLLAQLLAPDQPVFSIRPTLVPSAPARRARFEAFPGRRGSEVSGFTAAARVYER